MRLAGNVACLVAGEEEGERRDLLRRAEPPHRLPVDKSLPHCIGGLSGLLRRRRDAFFQRRRFDRSGTNSVAADALLMKSAATDLVSPITAALVAP